MVENQRKYQAYYTKSNSIVTYMTKLLNLNGSERILEPCAGDGVFIDSIINLFPNISIDALELSIDSVKMLLQKYRKSKSIQIRQTDYLKDTTLDDYIVKGGVYDAIIANPPYGAWREIEERKQLKDKFNGLYAKESYTLFLIHSINLLKEGGKLSFIIPDTWLNVHMHKQVRKYILTNTMITEISLFPSSFFPNVNFGYANLMIISLKKNSIIEENLNNKFNIYSNFKSVDELLKNNLSNISKVSLSQNQIFTNRDYSFVINPNEHVLNCINNNNVCIGDICDCVTGFYSGDDKIFLKVLNRDIKNSKHYELVDCNKVQYNCSYRDLMGLANGKYYVPIVKGGNTKYWKSDMWFMSWTKENVNHYITNKKSRYQNSSFYFKQGIGIPMVSSSSITAALINNRLFDQSIVGVFPKNENFLYYLLAFFNSPTCNILIRTINSSTNNSSNYIKKIPFIAPSIEDLHEVTKNTKEIITRITTENLDYHNLEDKNNNIFYKIYGF